MPHHEPRDSVRICGMMLGCSSAMAHVLVYRRCGWIAVQLCNIAINIHLILVTIHSHDFERFFVKPELQQVFCPQPCVCQPCLTPSPCSTAAAANGQRCILKEQLS